MGLFSFLKKKPAAAVPPESTLIPGEAITEDVNPIEIIPGTDNNFMGIEAIYDFLQGDYESKGFNDALTNPDDSYKQDNIRLIKLDLQILIQKVSTYYEDLDKELNLHIATRSRAGLIDLVEELESRKLMVSEHRMKVSRIQEEINQETSMSNRIILSYQRGFMRGLSAISQSKVLNKKI
jgi:hypothetical protein